MTEAWDLSTFETCQFAHDGRTREVFYKGAGPAVIVIHEMPGLHPLVLRFAHHVAEAGMTAVCPSLFGVPGRKIDRDYALGTMFATLCIRREFVVWANDKSSPIVDWLKALARECHAKCGGKGVGVVGMCFTGGFALSMMTEPKVVAPVVSQPSLPLLIGFGRGKRKAGIAASPQEVACARGRFKDENLSMIGLRFLKDDFVPDERFATYRHEFGDKFEAIEIDPKDAAPAPFPPHSVLTLHLAEDGPTKAAEARVLAFFRERTGAA